MTIVDRMNIGRVSEILSQWEIPTYTLKCAIALKFCLNLFGNEMYQKPQNNGQLLECSHKLSDSF